MTRERTGAQAASPLDDPTEWGASRFRLLAERGQDVLYRLWLTPAPVLTYVSPAALEVTGYTPDELLADPELWTRIVHPDDRALLDPTALRDLPSDVIETPVVLRWIHRDGSIRWTEHRSVAVRDDGGRLLAVEGAARDITTRVEAQERSRASEARFLDLLSSVELGTLVLDRLGRVEFINDFLLGVLGRERDELLGRDWIDMAAPEDAREELRAAFDAVIATGTGAGQREDAVVTRTGEVRLLLWTSVVQHDRDGVVVGVAAIAHDVTGARNAEAERTRLAAAIEQSAESVVITDPAGRIQYVNGAFERISGYAAAEVLGHNPRLLKSGVQSTTFYDAMWAALTSGLPWTVDIVNRRKDGSHYAQSSVMSPIRAGDGAITGYVSVGRDVSHERELESRAETLTRERALIGETLQSVPADADLDATAALFCAQVATLAGVVVASLVGFESDASAVPLAFVGPHAADIGLRRLTRTRSRYLREHAAAGPWVEEWVDDRAHPYARSIRIAGVRAVAYAPVRSDSSLMGVLMIGSAETDAVAQLSGHLGSLVDFADLAGAILGRRFGDRKEVRRLRAVLHKVIADRAFLPVYQPIVDLRHGLVVGHEALTRFADGTRPDIRFADAAAVGLGLELELATLEAAVDGARDGLPAARWLHLNVSPELILAGGALVPLLRAAPRRIILEITEHVAVDDYGQFREAISRIGRPIRLAVDDAGAGFASLRHILELEPAFVKLDISLVRGIDGDPAKQAMVAGMRHFARTTHRRLIAEGIETAQEATTLRALDVRLGQGYLLGRPAPIGADDPAS